MTNIMTLSKLKQQEEYISKNDHMRETEAYKQQIKNLNERLIQFSNDTYKNKDMIHLLKTQLKEAYKKLEHLGQQPQIKIVKPTQSEEGLFKMMNDTLMKALQLTDKQKTDIRKQNEAEIAEFMKECRQ